MSRNSKAKLVGGAASTKKSAAGEPAAPVSRQSAIMSNRWKNVPVEERKRLTDAMRSKQQNQPRTWGGELLKIDALLSEEDSQEYFRLLRRPNFTIKEAREWLQQHGCEAGEWAVIRHRRRFRTRLEQTRQAAELAHAMVEVGRQRGAMNLTEASVAHVEQQMMQTFFFIRAQRRGEKFKASQWERVQRILGHQVKNRATLEKLRFVTPELEQKQKKKKLAEMTLEERKEACREAASLGRKVLGLEPV